MFTYLQTLAPEERASEIAKIEQLVQSDPAALVPLYKQSALQQVSKDSAQTMITSITVITIGSILAGAYVGFPLALTAGTLMLAQQFLNTQKRKQAARWQIEDQGDFTQFLDRDTQREYRQFAAAVEQESGVKLPHGQTVDVTAHPVTLGTPTTTAELQQRLASECPSLLLLVKAPPIRLVGSQRSGKSTFARKLALLRAICLPGHQVAWATPHREADNPVPPAFNPFGTTQQGAKHFPAIEAVWQATQAAINQGQQLNTTVVWDEFGSYDQFEDGDALGDSLRSLLMEATKHGYFPILIAHGDQASFYPGVKNILKTLHSGTVKVETIGEAANAFGEIKPTGEVEVTWLDGSKVKFKVPDWLTTDLLLKLLPGQVRPALLDAIAPTPTPTPPAPTVPPQPKPVEQFVGEADAEKTAVSAVDRVKRKLAEKLKESGSEWANARDLLKSNFRDIDDRKMAHSILAAAIQKGMIEQELRENPNKTKSLFVRVKRKV